MVAHKEDGSKGNSQSQWLRETQSGAGKMSRWVWIISIILLLGIGAGIALGLILTRNTPHHGPVALGGAGCEGTNGRACSSSSVAHPNGYGGEHSTTSSASHVTTPTSTAVVHARSTFAPVSPLVLAADHNTSGLSERFVIIPGWSSPSVQVSERDKASDGDFLVGRHKAWGRRRRTLV